jgi:hypothetical protein
MDVTHSLVNKQLSFKPTIWRQQWTSCVAQLVKNPKHLLDLQKLVVDSVAVTKAAAIPVDPEPEG